MKPFPETIHRQRDYARGYNRGRASANKWPDHIPPQPPNEIIAGLMQAMRKMRDQADAFCATILEDDPWQEVLGPIIDECDQAMYEVSAWIRRNELIEELDREVV